MAISVVQGPFDGSATSDPEGVNFQSNVTAGNSIIVSIRDNQSGQSIVSVTDSLGNTYSLAKSATWSFGGCWIYAAHNITGGACSVTVDFGATPGAGGVGILEIAGIGDVDVTSEFEETSDTTSHNCAAVGEIDTTVAETFIVAASVLNGSDGGVAPASGFTELESISTRGLSQYKIATSLETDQRATWSSGNSRQSLGIIAAFKAAGGSAAEFDGTATGTASADGSLSTQITAAASALGQAAVTAVLTTAITLSSAVTASASAQGQLSTAIHCAASVSGTATVSADLSIPQGLQAAVTGQGSATGQLTTEIRCAASVSGSGTCSGDLSTAIRLAGSASGQVLVSADLTAGSGLQAAVSGQCSASANLQTAITCVGSASGQASASGQLSTDIRLAGSVSGTATAIADLLATEPIRDLLELTAAVSRSVQAEAAVTRSLPKTASVVRVINKTTEL